jgi:hypothetical protein
MITETKVRFDPAETDALLDAKLICERAYYVFDKEARVATEQDKRGHFVKKTRQAKKVYLAISELLEDA